MANVTRRSLLKAAGGAAIGALAGCTGEQETKPPSNVSDLIKRLSQFNFTDQKGDPIKISSLGSALQDKDIILSFTWAGCVSAHPIMYDAMANIEEKDKDLVHVMIDFTPGTDNLDQTQRNKVSKSVREGGKLKNKIILLYPESNEKLLDIQNSLGLIGNSNENSISALAFYGRNGKSAFFKSTSNMDADDLVKAWNNIVPAGVQR